MSGDQADYLALRQLQTSVYLTQSAQALYLFDSSILLAQEVEVLWRRKWTATTWLYAFTRYSTFIVAWVISVGNPQSYTANISQTCYATNIVVDVLFCVQFLCFASFGALRVYSLLRGNKPLVSAIVFAFGLMPFGVNIFIFATNVSVFTADPATCVTNFGVSPSLNIRLSLVARLGAIIADILVLIVTWSKTLQTYNIARKNNSRAPLVTLLVHDGTFYFIVLLVMNVLQLLADNLPSLLILNFMFCYMQVLTPIIVCRFILSLRQVNYDPTINTSAYLSTVRFAGSMGQTLQFGDSNDEEYFENSDTASCDELSGVTSSNMTTDGKIQEHAVAH